MSRDELANYFELNEERDFDEIVLDTFSYQYKHNPVYRTYADLLQINATDVTCLGDIPFLPISFFKTHEVICSGLTSQEVFESSRTTGQIPSRHLVSDPDIYIESFNRGFEFYYGNPKDYRFLALLPSYIERDGSSLVYMVDYLIQHSKFSDSGFFLKDLDVLNKVLQRNSEELIPTVLFGVSYALLDLAEIITAPIRQVIIMETGGMKGNRPELPKYVLHNRLCEAFGVTEIHSEYGMTELLSQAYSQGSGKFRTPPWMRVLIRDIYDPFKLMPPGRAGGINIVDLANRNSASFIETQDLGRLNTDGTFEVLGRLNQSDVRGCNLLVQ